MSEQRRTQVATISILIVLSLGLPAWAEDEAPAPEAVKTEYTWTASEAGSVVGIERLKGVLSVKRKRYTSIEVVPDKAQKSPRVTSFHERDADGTLRKYFRKQDVRLGKGIRAFRRGVGIRIVGINQKLEAVEIPKASEHHIWDPSMLSGLRLWLELASRSGEVSFKVLDIDQRASVTARVAPSQGITVGDPEGKATKLDCWNTWAGGAEVATICGDGAGTLVGVKAGRRALLLKDWTWDVPKPTIEVGTPGQADSVSSAGSDAGGEEPGVGP